MKIRNFTNKDEKKVKKMINETLIDIYGEKAEIKEWEDFNQYIIFYLAEKNNKIIGTAAIKKINNKTLKLKRMYVIPSVQGKGVGQVLMNKIMDFCIKNKYKRIILTTYKEMSKGINFYKKNGFAIVKNPSNEFFTHPKLKKYNACQIAMEKKL